MNKVFLSRLVLIMAIAVLASLAVNAQVGGTASAPATKQARSNQPVPAPTPAGTGDHLVVVNKHTMWASQVEKMHPELKKQAVAVSKENHNDFPVRIGKTTVMASTVRRDLNATQTRPAPHDKACRDYQVQVGKQTVWASSAQCPAGKHQGTTKPLCCVAPVGDESKLPRCCKDVVSSNK